MYVHELFRWRVSISMSDDLRFNTAHIQLLSGFFLIPCFIKTGKKEKKKKASSGF